MNRCPQCSAEVASDRTRCAACGAGLDRPARPPASGTRTLTQPGPGSDSAPPSSGSLDGARFVPGTLLAGRYRIVGLLGRGGMGEVYRAEDLKLSEPVALKFLPAELSLDGAALARFHREVRVARQIAHRNVCRVFDIGEAGGLHFLSMEYIDGEDLSSLLQRIGRLPGDKAVELARQICAGLGAAHEAGVLHRDMKPANVMIDGKGRAKITDFGLAQVAEELQSQDVFAGTPAYMAPEQIATGEVSVRTDLYALGLVLYEMFTGERAFPGEDWRDLMDRGRHGELSRPSSHVEGMDPLVERVIMRCLEEEPSVRPSSALEVSAALPGGDPVAAALAAGETPSPEMVAAAPEKGTLRPRVAASWLAGIVASVAVVAILVPAVEVFRLPKSPQVLEDRASTLLQDLGVTGDPADRAWGWRLNRAFVSRLQAGEPPADWPQRLRENDPPILYFWYRQSPETLRARTFGRARPAADDPPVRIPGEATVTLDPEGRLKALQIVPPRRQGDDLAAAPDWAPLFAAAGLDPEAFSPAAPRWAPLFFAPARAAWTGVVAGTQMRVEAAHAQGRPVAFEVLAEWDDAAAEWNAGGAPYPVRIMLTVFFLAAATAGLWLARRHLRSGRGDRRGAVRLAVFVAGCQLASWLLGAHHQPLGGVVPGLQQAIARALYGAGFLWLLYIAFEPLLRRRWPAGIVAWSRLLGGRYRDPLVGRDVLIGSALGAASAALNSLETASYGWLGRARPVPGAADFWEDAWRGVPGALAGLSGIHVQASLINALGSVFLFVLLLIVLRRKWLAAAVLFVPAALLFLGFQPSSGAHLVFPLLMATLIVLAVTRFGVLAAVAYWYVFFLLIQLPLTTDPSSWHAAVSLLAFGLPLFFGAWAFRTAVAGQPLAPSVLVEDPAGLGDRER